MRWRHSELRERDKKIGRLPEDWHDWMCCDADTYQGWYCTCDKPRPEPVKRYKTARVLPGGVVVDARHLDTCCTALVADPPIGRCIESAVNLLLDYLNKTPDAQARFHARSSPYRSPAVTHPEIAYPAESDEQPVIAITRPEPVRAVVSEPARIPDSAPASSAEPDSERSIAVGQNAPDVAPDHHALFGRDCPYDDSIVAYEPAVVRAQPIISRDKHITVGGSWVEQGRELVWAIGVGPFGPAADTKAGQSRLRPRQCYQRLRSKRRVRVPMGAGRIRRALPTLWWPSRIKRAVLQNN